MFFMGNLIFEAIWGGYDYNHHSINRKREAETVKALNTHSETVLGQEERLRSSYGFVVAFSSSLGVENYGFIDA